MSQAVPTAVVPSAAPATPEHRTRLRLVVPEFARARSSFAALCITAIVVGLIGVLVVNILISHSTYRVQQLSEERQQLTDRRDRLAEDLSYRMSPQNIENSAKAQGLKPAKSTKFIDESGRIVQAPAGGVPHSQTTVPGPRKDTRKDIRPNLRSDERLPVIGGSTGGLTPPTLETPK